MVSAGEVECVCERTQLGKDDLGYVALWYDAGALILLFLNAAHGGLYVEEGEESEGGGYDHCMLCSILYLELWQLGGLEQYGFIEV